MCNKKNKLVNSMTIFLGHASKKGATKEELDTIIKTIKLIPKYSPIKR